MFEHNLRMERCSTSSKKNKTSVGLSLSIETSVATLSCCWSVLINSHGQYLNSSEIFNILSDSKGDVKDVNQHSFTPEDTASAQRLLTMQELTTGKPWGR